VRAPTRALSRLVALTRETSQAEAPPNGGSPTLQRAAQDLVTPKNLLADRTAEAAPHLAAHGYKRLLLRVVLATATVSLLPLVIMTFVNLFGYEQALRTQGMETIRRLTTSNKRSLEFFLSERRFLLSYIVQDRSLDELCDSNVLQRVVGNINASLGAGAFVDLGIIDSKGEQICYSGPFALRGRSYFEQEWFAKVSRRGVFTSDVFLGFRNSPHFVIATRHALGTNDFYVLRATIDAESLNDQILRGGIKSNDDVFLVNTEGVLQSDSLQHGKVLSAPALPVPPPSTEVEVLEQTDAQGQSLSVGYAYIGESPFVLMVTKPASSGLAKWGGLHARLFLFLGLSAALILAVVIWGARQFVGQIREENIRRAALMHEVEYSNKLASIGRLAAGVAHEINNPLAIINEKAGLLKDIATMRQELPPREKFVGLADSIINSVDRCKKVTHRLLGFAKHMDVRFEEIDLAGLLQEVVGFLGKEAEYRNIRIAVQAPDVPRLQSDRGQLQQVFLNLLNNAVEAVKVRKDGRIDIDIGVVEDRFIRVVIADNGVGIPARNIERIFEPFFTTKEGSGTGLGLSITYGIVQKLGGRIQVESVVGEGTRFTVQLPIVRRV
jgi:signal transduction histidine kinase